MSGLNITPESILDLVFGISLIVGVIISKSRPQSRGIISFNLIMLAWVCFAFLLLLEAISFIFLDLIINIWSNLFTFYGTLVFLISMNYMKRENVYSPSMIGLVIFGTLYHVAGFMPGSVAVALEEGYLTIPWFGMFQILGLLLYVIIGCLIVEWGVRVWRHAPFELEKYAKLFFATGLFAGISSIIGMLLTIWFPFFIWVTDGLVLIAFFLYTYISTVEPKMFYILSFSIYKIDVRDSRGNSLFSFDWAKPDVKYSAFSKYLAKLQEFSAELIHSGGVIDLSFQGCQIIASESKYFATILFTSKISRVLRNSLLNFSKKFEEKFNDLLKNSVSDPAKYESANQLLQQYFNHFPSRMILNKKQKFFLSRLEQNLSSDTDSKIRQILRDEDEYEMVRDEMEKVPKCIPDSFIKLYDELKDENEEDKEPTQKKEDSPD